MGGGRRPPAKATLGDTCERRDGPPPDLVLLSPEAIPGGVMTLPVAVQDRFQVGRGHAHAGRAEVNARGEVVSLRDLDIGGEIAAGLSSDGRRQFTGSNPTSYWAKSGSSGSPVFVGNGQQLAGILSLAERGGEHEAFVVPRTVILDYLRALRAREAAAQQAIDPRLLQPVLAMIDAVIAASRARLAELDAPAARELLQQKIEEEELARRQRLLPLLRERAAVERIAFDHEAAKATLAEITRLIPDDVWAWIDLGDLWRRTGSLENAAGAYRNAEAAARRNGDERDLSVSHERIGDVLVAQGERAAALEAYRAGLAIRENLARRDPANLDWQRDLSVSHERIGDVLVAQGERAAALEAYRAGLAIRENLARHDPANLDWQRDLIVSCVKISEAEPAEARAMLTRALAIACRLEADGKLAPADAWMPAELARRLGEAGG